MELRTRLSQASLELPHTERLAASHTANTLVEPLRALQIGTICWMLDRGESVKGITSGHYIQMGRLIGRV